MSLYIFYRIILPNLDLSLMYLSDYDRNERKQHFKYCNMAKNRRVVCMYVKVCMI